MNIKYNYNVPKEELELIVKESLCISHVLRKIGIPNGQHNYDIIKRKFKEYNLDTSHFVGQKYSGKIANKKTLEYYFNYSERNLPTHRFKLRLIKEGIFEAKCNTCGLKEWNGKPAPLELNHIDGDRKNNKLENFEILCPNCHAQTDTYCAKNRVYQKKKE